MKITRPAIILLASILMSSCASDERERRIAQREAEVNLKQEQLLLRERQLALKEEELQIRELALDSTQKQIDSLPLYDPAIAGAWLVKMKCTETSCDGSAIGDVKTERWEIAYDINNEILVKAFSGPKISAWSGECIILKPAQCIKFVYITIH